VPHKLLSRALAALARLTAPAPRGPYAPAPLAECAHCGAECMCPISWEETDETHWWIRLRCGECQVWRDVVVGDDEAAALERTLGTHTALIERAVARLDLERMATDLGVLITALERDLIDPSSFAA
jgi:hypothetical protein